MSYTPINWQTGDIITAEKLNNIEEGVENSYNYNFDTVIKENGWAFLSQGIFSLWQTTGTNLTSICHLTPIFSGV